MLTSPVRVAVVGLGAWGTDAHLPSLAAHPDVTISAVADLDGDRLRVVAARYDVPLAVADLDVLWSRSADFDAIV